MSPRYLTLAVVIAGCMTNHDGATQVDQSSCYACHVPDYQQTTAPAHASSGCPTTCADCHTTATWTSPIAAASGGCGHPEARFPIKTGSHTNIACTSCHNTAITASYVKGANADCTSCHPQPTIDPSHTGTTGYSFGSCTNASGYPCTQHNFCLTCHPNGAGGTHPQNLFPLPHGGAACAQCHDRASGLPDSGGQNVLCVTSGCHTGAHHKDTNHHPGCLTCHPRGTGG